MKKSLTMFGAAAFAAVLGMAGLANAATISYSGGFTMDLSPGSDTVNLSQFNPALGTLTAVTLDLSGSVQAHVTAENDSAIAGSMGVDLTGLLGASGPGSLSTSAGITQSAGPVSVTASDGTADSGGDYVDFGTISGSNSANNTIISGFSAYVGTGTITFNITGNGGFAVNGVSNSTIHVTDFGGDGTAKVTYTYTPVPEPASLGLFAIGGLMMIRRRRDR